jgi:hypothetical protein
MSEEEKDKFVTRLRQSTFETVHNAYWAAEFDDLGATLKEHGWTFSEYEEAFHKMQEAQVKKMAKQMLRDQYE